MSRKKLKTETLWLGCAIAASGLFLPKQAQAAESKAYSSVYECVFKGHLPKKTCIDAFDDAWDVYRERAPRFKTRIECNAIYKVCVVFNPPGFGGRPAPPLKASEVTYAPPLLSVALSNTGDALEVLIDTTRKPLAGGVPRRNAPIAPNKPAGFVGSNFAPPIGSFVPRKRDEDWRYLDAPDQAGISATPAQIDAPGASSLDGVSSFPVPENRRRKR